MSAQDEEATARIRRRSLTVANVRQNGCQLGCQDLCLLRTHRFRTAVVSCPPVSRRLLQRPPVLDSPLRRVLACPPISLLVVICFGELVDGYARWTFKDGKLGDGGGLNVSGRPLTPTCSRGPSSATQLAALDEVAVPAVEPHLPARTVDRQHPGDLSVLHEMKGVVAVESVGCAGRVAPAPLVEPALGDLCRPIERDCHRT